MPSAKQKQFNTFMDSYIKKKRKAQAPKFQLPKFQLKAKEEIIEMHELEEADEQLTKKGLLTRIYDTIFGTKAVIQEEDFEEAELPHQEPLTEPPKEIRPSYIDSIKRVLFGAPVEEEDFEEPTIKKVYLYKPKTDQDIKALIKIADSLQKSLSIVDRHRFRESENYKLFTKLKKKYS